MASTIGRRRFDTYINELNIPNEEKQFWHAMLLYETFTFDIDGYDPDDPILIELYGKLTCSSQEDEYSDTSISRRDNIRETLYVISNMLSDEKVQDDVEQYHELLQLISHSTVIDLISEYSEIGEYTSKRLSH